MNKIDRINLPKNIDEVTKNAVKKAKSVRENNKRKSKVRKTIIAASIAGFIVVGGTLSSDMVSASIGGIINKIETFFQGNLKNEVIKDYKSIVGTTKESNGVKITLNEFFMDDENLYVNAKFHSIGKLKAFRETEYKVLLNGKEVPVKNADIVNYKHNEDNSVDILLQRDIKKMDLTSIKDVKVVFNSATYEGFNKSEDVIKGKWEFNFKFNGEKISSYVKNIKVNKSIDLKDNNLVTTIESIKISPMKISIKYSYNKEYPFESPRGIGILDKNGKVVRSSNGNGHLNSYVENIFIDTKDVKEIILVPYKVINGEKLEAYNDKAIKVNITE